MKVKELINKLLDLDMEKSILIDITPPENAESPFISIDRIADHGEYYLII